MNLFLLLTGGNIILFCICFLDRRNHLELWRETSPANGAQPSQVLHSSFLFFANKSWNKQKKIHYKTIWYLFVLVGWVPMARWGLSRTVVDRRPPHPCRLSPWHLSHHEVASICLWWSLQAFLNAWAERACLLSLGTLFLASGTLWEKNFFPCLQPGNILNLQRIRSPCRSLIVHHSNHCSFCEIGGYKKGMTTNFFHHFLLLLLLDLGSGMGRNQDRYLGINIRIRNTAWVHQASFVSVIIHWKDKECYVFSVPIE